MSQPQHLVTMFPSKEVFHLTDPFRDVLPGDVELTIRSVEVVIELLVVLTLTIDQGQSGVS